MSTAVDSSPLAGEWDEYEEWDEAELSAEQFAYKELNRLGDALEQSVREDARTAAARYAAIEEFRIGWDASGVSGAGLSGMSARAMRAELATRMGVSERTMESLIGYARVLVGDLPETLRRLRNGRFTERHARIMADETVGLDADERAEFERRALPHAEELTAQKFARKARTLRELIHARDLDERHRAAKEDREIRLTPAPDGMAWLSIYLPAIAGVAAYSRLERIVKGTDDPDRTQAQIRVDAFIDIMLDEGAVLPPAEEETSFRSPTIHRGIRPDVHITVPVLGLLGKDETPATLDGYGPISIEAAAELAGNATGFLRILTHPETGIALSFGRERYEVPTGLKRYLRVRDETCRFAGCNRAAVRCDLDHTTAWEDGGETTACNLAHLCRGHHSLKHETRWSVAQARDGSGELTWTSPLGQEHVTRPAIQNGAGLIAQERWYEEPPPF